MLRRGGKTYAQIREMLRAKIPPSTLCTWFKQINFSAQEKERIKNGIANASATRKLAREKRLKNICNDNIHLKDLLNNKDVAKICLIMLYLCEGSKHQNAALCFGNSDPGIIQLFLRLLRQCYILDEKKLCCTVQCRADQDVDKLMSFWSETTLVPMDQFYRSRIDKRTIGFPTKKTDYKGVCRIDYFSAAIYNELRTIGEFL